MKQILLIILLTCFSLASFSQPLMGIINSSQNNIADAVIAADLANETFNITGYDLGAAWTETVGSGSVVDENNTETTDNLGGASQVLKIQKVSPNFDARSSLRSASPPAISYTQFYVKVTAQGVANGNTLYLLRTFDAGGLTPYGVRLYYATSVLYFQFRYYNNGAYVNLQSSAISLNTWYKVEVKWDITNLTWEFRINDVSVGSGALTGTLYGNPRDWCLGMTDTYTLTSYYDSFKISSIGYPTP